MYEILPRKATCIRVLDYRLHTVYTNRRIFFLWIRNSADVLILKRNVIP